MANWTFDFIVSFCWKFVPETKGKHLEDIQAYFQEKVDKKNEASA